MKYLVSFLLLSCVLSVQAQSCMKITWKVTSNTGQEENVLELTFCGDKSLLIEKNNGTAVNYITNPEEGTFLVFSENNKMAAVLPLDDKIFVSKFKEEDFHFTGKTKMIAGYNCEEFTIDKGIIQTTGYLTREMHTPPIPGAKPQKAITANELGTVMESVTAFDGLAVTRAVTKVETVVIEDPNAYFSTAIPEGYTDFWSESTPKQ
jgi:hypothetical protein